MIKIERLCSKEDLINLEIIRYDAYQTCYKGPSNIYIDKFNNNKELLYGLYYNDVLCAGCYVSAALVCLLICILILVHIIKLMNSLSISKNSYDKLLKRILKEYDRLIVNTSTYPDMTKTEVIKVYSFNELLDAKENLHKPIYFHEITAHQKCIFFIRSENELIVYTLKDVDIDN